VSGTGARTRPQRTAGQEWSLRSGASHRDLAGDFAKLKVSNKVQSNAGQLVDEWEDAIADGVLAAVDAILMLSESAFPRRFGGHAA